MFVLLKVLLFFFRPLTWIVVFFIIAAASRKETRKKIFFRTALVLLLFFSNPFIIRQILHWYEPEPLALSPNETYSAGIVLGGFVSYHMKDQTGYFNGASDRFIQTALLYKAGHIKKIIIPAGNGYMVKNNFREADFIKQRFVELGIPPEDIFTDAASRNTLENAINTKKIMDSAHIAGPFLLISSAMHLPRAQKLFNKNGMTVKLYPCDYASKNLANNFPEDYLLPSGFALHLWDNFIKELVGTLAYKITGKT
jgi:uncharacterized SAM-binding protein YcdF (DUF218 family)